MITTVPYYAFPDRYGDNYLRLMVRDPNCLFAYWEFSDEQMDLISKEFGSSWGEIPLVMRVYDLTGLNSIDVENAHNRMEISINSMANNYYFKEARANCSYCVDLGIYTREGRFVTLLRSNTVLTPRDSMADGSGVVMADMLERMLDRTLKDTGSAAENTFSSESFYQSNKK